MEKLLDSDEDLDLSGWVYGARAGEAALLAQLQEDGESVCDNETLASRGLGDRPAHHFFRETYFTKEKVII